VQFSLVTCLRFPFQASVSFLLLLHLGVTFSTASIEFKCMMTVSGNFRMNNSSWRTLTYYRVIHLGGPRGNYESYQT